MLDQAFAALKTFDWGTDPNVIKPISEAIVSSHGNAAARKDLETRLIEIVKGAGPQAGKDAACRALKIIGTGACVPALSALLADEKLSHMARFALEQNPSPEAGKALAEAIAKVPAKLKVGMACSLGVRQQETAVAALTPQLADADISVARAAAFALGSIGTATASAALATAKPAATTKEAVADSLLKCAEKLLASGKKSDAKAIYDKILASEPTKGAKIAATLGASKCS